MPELFGFWLVLGAIGGAVELWAVWRDKHGDTLSESTRWLLIHRNPKLKWITLAAWLSFAGWFAYHIWFDYTP
jgi:hypothetical protein